MQFYSNRISDTRYWNFKSNNHSKRIPHIHFRMKRSKAISLVIFLSIVASTVNCLNQQDALLISEQAKVEETDYNSLCNDLNVTVSFSGMTLNQIQENFLSSPLITCLDLSQNQINTVFSNAFNNLPNLRYLDLSDNSIDLNDFFKNSFFNLENLVLNNAVLHNYHLLISGTYSKLRKLYLKNSNYYYSGLINIKAMSKTNFPMLSHLDLSGNKIAYDEFSWLPESLEYLDLTGSNLQSITLKNLKHLKWLFLQSGACPSCYNHKLNNIHLENLQSLLYLSLPSNYINEITSSTFLNVTSLKYLDLSDNNIKDIEADSFQSMQNLEFLNISNNYLEGLHYGTLDRLKNLNTLILEKNLLSSIPIFIEELNLEFLLLNCNNIKNVGRKVFVQLPNLKELYLQDNEISQIDEEAFVGLEKLNLLILSNNKLSVLPSNWILPLISLNELDLTGNQFIKFGHLGLNELSPVKNLYLSNQLRYIEPQSTYTMPENATIYLNETFPHFENCVKNDEKYRRQLYG